MGWQEVQVERGGLTVVVKRSKTDQVGKGRVVRVYPIQGSFLCPVSTVGQYLQVRTGVQGPLLIHQDGSFYLSSSSSQFLEGA